MKQTLKALYDCFYEPPLAEQEKSNIQECHQKLIDILDKPERRLVLQIIDGKDHIAEDLSIDSFIAGFRLASHLYQELHIYDKTHQLPTQSVGAGAFCIFRKTDEDA